MEKSRLQYCCSKCNSVLCETEPEISLSVESCPYCGSPLSESLEKKYPAQKTDKVVFHIASQIPRLTLDIAKIDPALHFFSLHQKVALVGYDVQKLIERMIVRAQLPHKYGGLDSSVILIDAGNSSDPYLCVNFARQYGLDVKKTLSKIISARAFTIYQLESLILHLPNVIKKYNAKCVVISDLLEMFVNDPYLDKNGAQRLLGSILQSISKLDECLVVVSISKSTKYDKMIFRSIDKVIHLSNVDDVITMDFGSRIVEIKTLDMEIVFHR